MTYKNIKWIFKQKYRNNFLIDRTNNPFLGGHMHASTLHRSTLLVGCLFTAIILTGCASTEQMQQVETRVDNQSYTLNQVRDRIEQLTAMMESLTAKQTSFQTQQKQSFDHFTQSYSPQIRAELDANLAQSQSHRDKVLQLKNASQTDRNAVATLLGNSEKELAVIKQNRKESDVVNVVNQFEKMIAEFNKLNRNWDQTVTDFKTESVKHSAAVKNSTQAVNAALAEASNARAAADKAESYTSRVQAYELRIMELERDLQRAQKEINRLERDVNSVENKTRFLEMNINSVERKVDSHRHN
jgi:septal ring factor EnvC (AmiA/AmiB activator)